MIAERTSMEQRIVKVNEDLQELCTHGTETFPMTVSHDDLTRFKDRHIRCHWHNDLEIVILQHGAVHYQVGDFIYLLSPGQGLVINSNVPHSAAPYQDSHVILLTVIVRLVFLYDIAGSDIEQNCLRPFVSSSLSHIFLDPKEEWAKKFIAGMHEIDDLFVNRPRFFELKIKSILCSCFFHLLSENSDKMTTAPPSDSERLHTLHILLEYIHSHYNENISLRDLAAEAHIGRESCCRLFKQMIGKTITEYITDYRIRRSIPLLDENICSITQISERLGFSSPSRFAHAFRLRIGQSPRDYLHQKQVDHNTFSSPM